MHVARATRQWMGSQPTRQPVGSHFAGRVTRTKHGDSIDRFVCRVWTFSGPTGAAITCELWEVACRLLEVRLMRAGECYHSAFCVDGPDQAATFADAWADALRRKGFREMRINPSRQSAASRAAARSTRAAHLAHAGLRVSD